MSTRATMRSMRPLFSPSLAMACALALAACGSGGSSSNEDEVQGTGAAGHAVLRVENSELSTSPIVSIRVVTTSPTVEEQEVAWTVAPGEVVNLRDFFGTGYCWVTVEYASGFRTQPQSPYLADEETTTMIVTDAAMGPATLAGSWIGTWQDTSGATHTISLTFDMAGALAQVARDNVDAGLTGTCVETAPGVIRVTLSDASIAALLLDSTKTHAGLVFADGAFGVLQRDTGTMLPVHTTADVAGNFSGVHARLSGPALAVEDIPFASANYYEGGTWTGQDVYLQTVFSKTPLEMDSPDTGRFVCDYGDAATTLGTLTLFVSPDSTFAAGAYRPASATSLDDWTFFALTRYPPVPEPTDTYYDYTYYDYGGYGYYDSYGYY